MVDFDPYKVVRNEQTLAAHRARMKGAMKASAPFFTVPMVLNPAPYLPLMHGWMRHQAPWLLMGGAMTWIGLMLASLGYGVYRRFRYLREHPGP